MGRIKSAAIKKTAKKLSFDNKEIFSANFENNKKLLIGLVANKRTRNLIAGYITKLTKRK